MQFFFYRTPPVAPSINIKILPLTSKLARVHFPFTNCLFLRNTQGRRKLFYGGGGGGGGWVKISATMVGGRRKIKKKHWLKRPRGVPKKRNLNQNINYSESHIWNSFFENSISGTYKVFIFVQKFKFLSSGHHQRFFFLISEFLAESSTKPFRDARELHSWST